MASPNTVTFEIPEEGMKLICIAGKTPEGNAVWKEVGKLTVARTGKVVLLLDSTFNPAGVYKEDRQSASVILNVMPYREDELARLRGNRKGREDSYSSAPRPTTNIGYDDYPKRKVNTYDDLGDDIPF